MPIGYIVHTKVRPLHNLTKDTSSLAKKKKGTICRLSYKEHVMVNCKNFPYILLGLIHGLLVSLLLFTVGGAVPLIAPPHIAPRTVWQKILNGNRLVVANLFTMCFPMGAQKGPPNGGPKGQMLIFSFGK